MIYIIKRDKMPIIKQFEGQEFITKCVTIRKDQNDFLSEEKGKGNRFKLAKFLQFKLDEYIEFRREAEKFSEKCKTNGNGKNGKK